MEGAARNQGANPGRNSAVTGDTLVAAGDRYDLAPLKGNLEIPRDDAGLPAAALAKAGCGIQDAGCRIWDGIKGYD